MLLLVVQTQFDERIQVWRQVVGLVQKPAHVLVYVGAVFVYPGHGRAAEVTPVGAQYPLAHGFVVAVEHVAEIVVENPVTGRVGHQHERFPKPGCVAEVPFGRADVGGGLHHVIFGFQPPANRFGVRPNAQVLIGECVLSNHLILAVGGWLSVLPKRIPLPTNSKCGTLFRSVTICSAGLSGREFTRNNRQRTVLTEGKKPHPVDRPLVAKPRVTDYRKKVFSSIF